MNTNEYARAIDRAMRDEQICAQAVECAETRREYEQAVALYERAVARTRELREQLAYN